MIKIYPNKEQGQLATQGAEAMAEHLTNPAQKTLLLLSGGSAQQVYAPLAALLEKQESLQHLACSVLDERFDRANSNYFALRATPLANILEQKGAKLFGITDYNDNGPAEAGYIDQELRYYRQEGYRTVALLGMGPDGHVSGVMPYPENQIFFNRLFVTTPKYAIYYDATGKNEFTKRITTTIAYIQTIDYACCYITGDTKARKLQQALKNGNNLAEIPFSVIHKMKDIHVFTDISL